MAMKLFEGVMGMGNDRISFALGTRECLTLWGDKESISVGYIVLLLSERGISKETEIISIVQLPPPCQMKLHWDTSVNDTGIFIAPPTENIWWSLLQMAFILSDMNHEDLDVL